MPTREVRRTPRCKARTPSYRLHKASGQAVVSIRGKDFHLGKHGSRESRLLYARFLAKVGVRPAGGH